MFQIVLALMFSRTHGFYPPPWASVSPALNPPRPRPALLLLKCCGSQSALLHHHGNRPSNHMAASPNPPFYLDITTSGAELGRNLEAHSCFAGLDNAPDWFTDFSVSQSRCAGYISFSDRTHLHPSTHCKAFLKLSNGPASDDLWHPETIFQRVAGFAVTD